MTKIEISNWVTSFSYAVGTLQLVIEGNSDKHILGDKYSDFKEYLTKEEGLLTIPMVVGIYQERLPLNESESFKQERLKAERKRDETIDNRIKQLMGCEDTVDRNLIHISYDPAVFDSGLLRSHVNDKMERLAFSQISRILKFQGKNVALFYDILLKEKEMLEKILGCSDKILRKKLFSYQLSEKERELIREEISNKEKELD